MKTDITKTIVSLFVVALALTAIAAYSFFSPLAMQSTTPLLEDISRIAAHFLPALLPLILGVALGFDKVWAWYGGVIYMTAMFLLGVYLSLEHFVFILHGVFILPTFFLLSLLAIPPLYLLLRGKMRLLKQLRDAAS